MRRRLTEKSKIAYVYKKRGDRRSNVLVFFAHATGMHKELFLPNVERIEKRFVDFDFAALDFRGHGDSPKLDLDENGFMKQTWDSTFVEDVFEVLEEIPKYEYVVGCGHSMGAANLVHTQLSRDCFDGLVLCEPILPFPGGTGLMRDSNSRRHPFAERTMRRRNGWKSVEDALKYFHSKSMFARWHKECVHVHVREGLVLRRDELKLKCDPVQEASIYDGTGSCVHDRLRNVTCPTITMVGEGSFHMSGPNMKTVPAFQAISSMFSNPVPPPHRNFEDSKNAWIVPKCTHFFPQEKPDSVANAVVHMISLLSREKSKL